MCKLCAWPVVQSWDSGWENVFRAPWRVEWSENDIDFMTIFGQRCIEMDVII